MCHFKKATRGGTHWVRRKPWPGCANSPTPRLLSIHILLENILLENEPAESDQVLEHLDTAVPEVPAPAPEKIRNDNLARDMRLRLSGNSLAVLGSSDQAARECSLPVHQSHPPVQDFAGASSTISPLSPTKNFTTSPGSH